MLTPQELRDVVNRFFGGRNAISKDDAYSLALEVVGVATQKIAARLKETLDAGRF